MVFNYNVVLNHAVYITFKNWIVWKLLKDLIVFLCVCNVLLSNCNMYVNIAFLHYQKGNYNQLSVIVIKVYSVIKQTFVFVYIF